MNHSLAPRRGNLHSSTWILDSIRTVRDRLLSLPAEDLADARDELALTLSECVGGLSVAPDRFINIDKRSDLPAPTKIVRDVSLAAMTPLDLLAMGVPVAGGAPEYTPTAEEYAEYASWSEQLERSQRDDWICFNDRLAELHEGVAAGGRLTDEDVANAGSAVG